MKKRTMAVIKELESAQRYCKKHNGLPICKNCGLKFKDLIKLLQDE